MRRRTKTLRRRYGRAGYLAKPLAFPNVKSFKQLFSSAKPYVTGVSDAPGKMIRGSGGQVIGRYLHVDDGGFRSFEVTPTKKLVDWIGKNTLALDRDRLYFEIIDRGGEALVVIKYNLIIGDRWLAMINPKTIPAGGD